MLLELIIGLEFQAIDKQTAQSVTFAILPFLLSRQHKDSSFQRFPFVKLGLLSPESSVMTDDRAATILTMLGVDSSSWTLQVPGTPFRRYIHQN